jgi:AraC-like DNA-binding protein
MVRPSGGRGRAQRLWGVPRATVTRIEDDPLLREAGSQGRDFFLILFVERGGGRHAIGGTEYETSPGDLYVIPPDEAHDSRELGPTAGWMLGFMSDALMPDVPAAPSYAPLPGDARWLAVVRGAMRAGPKAVVPVPDRPRWSRRFAETAIELDARRYGYQQAVRAQLALTLVDTARLLVPEARRAAIASDRIQAALEVVDARYADDLSVGAVAAAVASSPSQLGRVVRRVTGQSIRNLIEERRMQEARRLLLDTEQTVDNIARSVGYRDPKYFQRRFRQLHDLPPQRWRELNR